MKEGSPTFKNPSSPERRVAGTAFGSGVVVSVVGEVKGGGVLCNQNLTLGDFGKGRVSEAAFDVWRAHQRSRGLEFKGFRRFRSEI